MSDNATSTGSTVKLAASWQGNIVGCAVATWVIAAIFVGLRFWLRGHLLKVLGSEDWFALAALAFSAAHSACYIVDAHYGLGRYAEALSTADLERVTEIYWFGMLWFGITIMLTKISILCLYTRTLTHAWVQKTLRVLFAMVILTSLAGIGLTFTACIPLQAYWNRTIKNAYCHSIQAYYAILGIQLGTDFLTFLLPLPVIWSMRAPKDQKIMLLVLFSFGFFICVVSIIRLTELATIQHDTDFTHNSIATDFWSLVEINTSIVCACIMTMKPLLSRLVPGSTKRGESAKDPLGLGGAGGGFHHTVNPPTIGSKPSRPNGVVKKQSWFTAQLARVDRSLQTLSEAETGAGAGAGEVAGQHPVTAEAGLQRPPPSLFLLPDVLRRSRNRSGSRLSTPVEHEVDEGPLEQQRWARRPSCAPSSPSPSMMRRPSAAPSSPITLRRPSCAPSIPETMRRPSCAPSVPPG